MIKNLLFNNVVASKKDKSKDINNNLYTIHYTPKEDKPEISSLFDLQKYTNLIKEINLSNNISDEDKELLRLTATRHIKYNFDKLADYYYNSSQEVQKFMEKQHLVIIDTEDALDHGYLEFNQKVRALLKEIEE